MMTDEELELFLEAFQKRMDAVNTRYLELMGKHIGEIGTLKPSDLHRLKQMKRMGKNIAEIEREIADVAKITAEDVKKLIEQAATEAYGDYAAYGLSAITTDAALQATIAAQAEQTAGAVFNLSNTTVVKDWYKNCVDAGITAVQTGVQDYQGAVRGTIREAATQGCRVKYASGFTRRLDTAARQNVLDGTRQINRLVARAAGEKFGADGVELSAHMNCAEDHLPYQGKQFSNKEFEQLQSSLERPIGEWSCHHFAFPIIVGVSSPAHSNKELDEMRKHSTELITIGNETNTRYQWTQIQRKMETKVRYAKDEAVACNAAGDDVGRRNAQSRINVIDHAYTSISKEAGIPMKRERMAVAKYKRVKSNAELATTELRKIATPNGIKISGISEHAYAQAVERGVTMANVKDSLTYPLHIDSIKTDDRMRPSARFIGNRATTAVNTDDGTISTVWPTGSRYRKKYGGTP